MLKKFKKDIIDLWTRMIPISKRKLTIHNSGAFSHYYTKINNEENVSEAESAKRIWVKRWVMNDETIGNKKVSGLPLHAKVGFQIRSSSYVKWWHNDLPNWLNYLVWSSLHTIHLDPKFPFCYLRVHSLCRNRFLVTLQKIDDYVDYCFFTL